MSEKLVRLSANVPEDSPIYKAVLREQELTGRNVADVIRDALVNRYGIKVDGNGKEAK